MPLMKRLLTLFFLIITMFAKAQTIGVQGQYLFGMDKKSEYISPEDKDFSVVAGAYFEAPIYKKLFYHVGLNYAYYNQYFLPVFDDPIPAGAFYGDYSRFNARRGYIELPVGLSLGLYAKNDAKVQVWAHANYAYGQMVNNRFIYNGVVSDFDGKQDITVNDYTHSINAELELRFKLFKKYYASALGQFRYTMFNHSPSELTSSTFVGIGLRLGFNLPKKDKE